MNLQLFFTRELTTVFQREQEERIYEWVSRNMSALVLTVTVRNSPSLPEELSWLFYPLARRSAVCRPQPIGQRHQFEATAGKLPFLTSLQFLQLSSSVLVPELIKDVLASTPLSFEVKIRFGKHAQWW